MKRLPIKILLALIQSRISSTPSLCQGKSSCWSRPVMPSTTLLNKLFRFSARVISLSVLFVNLDGGNSHFTDSIRRCKQLESEGFLFVGSGVSGGEEGARYGPSLMPGGSPAAWPFIKKMFQDISAKTSDGDACCDWVGEGGSGHYVKMVHNGIEYGDMQILSEAYLILKNVLDLSADEMANVFDEWNKGELDCFLMEITRDILRFKDTDGTPLVEKIRDCAGQKGTGKWTATSALDNGMPLTLIGEAVFARCLSSIKEERTTASAVLNGPKGLKFSGDKKSFIEDIRQAVYAAKIISYAQGFMLLREAAKAEKWNLNYGGVALMWRGGCIIRRYYLLTKRFPRRNHKSLPHKPKSNITPSRSLLFKSNSKNNTFISSSDLSKSLVGYPDPLFC